MKSGTLLQDNVPIWRKENRRPTRAELAEKHVADGGSMAYAIPVNPLADSTSDAFFKAPPAETELVPVGDTGAFVRQVKEAPASTVKVKRHK